MYFLFMMAMVLLLFVLQLIICTKERKLWLKLLPGLLLGVFEFLCWGMFLLTEFGILEQIYSVEVGFAAMILGFMGLFWTGSILLAWLVYGIGRRIRRVCRRKRAKRL